MTKRPGKRPGKLAGGKGWTVVRECPRCRRPESECVCASGSSRVDDGPATITLRLEKRRGKPSTILAVAGMDSEEFRELVRELKTRCAAGGSAKGEEGVIQGDHRERVRALLKERGVRVKG